MTRSGRPTKRMWSAPLLVASLLFPIALRGQGIDSARATRIDEVFARFVARPAPGCALAVKQNGAIAYEHGYGMASMELSVPITPRTVFDIGSVSKQFTAASVLLLAIDGKLSLDDDIRKYLPELPDLGPRVTLRHLITHTSGWRDYNDLLMMDGFSERDQTTDRDAWATLKRQTALNFPPGATYRYSNTGFFLLGQVVNRVAGKSLAAFARERIFEPLGMTQTQFLDDTRRIVPSRATAYMPDESGYLVEMSNWDQLGDGAVQTTVGDLAKWEGNFDEPKVGGAKLLEMLLTHGRLNSGAEIAYTAGLVRDRYRGLERVSHSGAWAGYRAAFLRFPSERLAVLVTCNRADGNPSVLGMRVADLLLSPATTAGEDGGANGSPSTSSSTANRERAGTYVSEADGVRMAFVARGDTLLFGSGAEAVALRALHPGVFANKSGNVTWAFGRDVVVFTPGSDVPDTLRRVRPAAPATAATLDAYVGTYASPEIAIPYTFVRRDTTLYLRLPHGDDVPLVPAYVDAFEGGDVPTIRFVRDAGGRVTALSFTGRGIHDLRLRRR